MTSHGRLNGNLCGFEVANFTNHDDVGVLPQDGAQGLGKGQINFGVDLRLAHPGQFIFDGIFHRHDVAACGVQALQRGIQGGGFARACGAGDQDQPMGLCHQLLEAVQGVALHADILQAETCFRFV